jgi:chromosome segregation ATPase
METKVLTQEELQSLKSIQEKRIQLTEQFGIVEMRIQEIELQKEILKEELKKLQKEEIAIGESLQKTYGDGTINLEKGEFIGN